MIIDMAACSRMEEDAINTPDDESDPINRYLIANLLEKVSLSEAHFISQQRGEPDLTPREKRVIAGDILREGAQKFLARFAKYLDAEDLQYFQQFRGNYEIDFYVKEILERSGKKDKIRIKNRRYEALKRLINEGDYFSDTEMKKRNPLLFEQLVGKYLSDGEKEALNKIDISDLRFSKILLEHIDRNYENDLHLHQRMAESTPDYSESEDEDGNVLSGNLGDCEEILPETDPISDKEKQLLRDEFMSIMHQSFLDGNDEDFNYSCVDDNAEYDAMDVTQQDAEDVYFDAEEPDIPETMEHI